MVSLRTQTDFGRIFRIILSVKCKLNNTKLFFKQFHIQSKEIQLEIGNNKYYEKTTELEKWQNEISPEYSRTLERRWKTQG